MRRVAGVGVPRGSVLRTRAGRTRLEGTGSASGTAWHPNPGHPPPRPEQRLLTPLNSQSNAPAAVQGKVKAPVRSPEEMAKLKAQWKKEAEASKAKQKALAPQLKAERIAKAARKREQVVQQQAYELQLQKDQQAYVEKMMPIWQRQQEMNVKFSIEAAKAQALQSMAATAKRKAMYDAYNDMQRNAILADEARILQRMSPP